MNRHIFSWRNTRYTKVDIGNHLHNLFILLLCRDGFSSYTFCFVIQRHATPVRLREWHNVAFKCHSARWHVKQNRWHDITQGERVKVLHTRTVQLKCVFVFDFCFKILNSNLYNIHRHVLTCCRRQTCSIQNIWQISYGSQTGYILRFVFTHHTTQISSQQCSSSRVIRFTPL